MLISTRGIILRVTKYRETSIIVNIYTEELGLNSFIVNSVRSAKAKYKIGYFEALNLVELTAYHRPGRAIDRISEIRAAPPIHNIRQDIYKSTISLFMTEVLNKCIIEQDKNQPLFNYLYKSILALEVAEQNNSFHLQFMIKLAKYLGFGIHDTKAIIRQSNNLQFYEQPETNRILQGLLDSDLTEAPVMTPEQRTNILNDIVHYYHTQLDMPQLKSLEVLRTVFK
jgi:DNA repair protein RecO (recombination protein O)